jgi:large subunit ribosomal protein L25
MSNVVLAANNRQETGSAVARRLRRAGRIPAVLYGKKGDPISLDIGELEFVNGTKGITESTIIQVKVDGKSHNVFVKDAQRNILDGKILHIDFYEVESDRIIHAKIPLVINGNPVGVREGGLLELPRHEIEVACLPAKLPERLFVDISGLKIGQSIHVRDIEIGEGVRLITHTDDVVALVKFPRGASETETATEEAAAPEEAEKKA